MKPGSEIIVTASDKSGIHHIGYAWNQDATKAVYSATAIIVVPNNFSNNNRLYVYAKDASLNYNDTGWQFYEFEVHKNNSYILRIINIICILLIVFLLSKKIKNTINIKPNCSPINNIGVRRNKQNIQQ
jgi:hypothetical protein